MDMHVSFRDGLAVRHSTDWDPSTETAEILQVRPTQTYSINESNFSGARIQNACGFAYATNHRQDHPAWLPHSGVFGRSRKAYTLVGNLSLRQNRVTFKGATQPQQMRELLATLLDEPVDLRLQLVVLSIGIGRCLFVMLGCLLERRVSYLGWADVMHRIEEVCSVVVFYVTDWRAMESALGMAPWDEPPKSTTVSVTRRGTLTLRLSWDSARWSDNEFLYDVARRLAAFVRGLV